MIHRAIVRLGAYARLVRLDRPIGIWLLMWPAMWALWLSSNGDPDERVFLVFVAGTVLTRSAGCAINDFADRQYDGHVARTKGRPLVTGEVRPAEAVGLCCVLGVAALGLVSTLNRQTQVLALAGGVLLLTYPLMKRFFPAPQLYLGAAFTWSVPMAFAAHNGGMPRAAWLLFAAGLLWTVAYDTMYAMVDRDDDRALGIRSTAILFGDADRLVVGIMQAAMLITIWLAGRELHLGAWHAGGVTAAALFALHQQFLIRRRGRTECMKAFANNNYVGMVIFAGIALEYLFRS
ncbi:4-hydroxybenzoate octaprenyltransferase [Sphaerisporangium sp. NPDC051017]|uniref:4-hydroxybenzoate octaprenyltransferase n=1 Tax=Sphaerisporangium sp. NPDC051017 TaxID=3154636 RepID=UPI003421EE55